VQLRTEGGATTQAQLRLEGAMLRLVQVSGQAAGVIGLADQGARAFSRAAPAGC